MGILKTFSKKYKKLRIFRKVNFNIVQGRNYAVKLAKYHLIASIDVGCHADRNWLRNLYLKWKESKADVVAGVFKPWIELEWDEREGYFQVPDIRKLKDDWEPSSRSILFRKEIWKIVGGYPENTYTAEDTLFNKRLEKINAKYILSKDAIVYWKMRGSLKKCILNISGMV